MSNFLKNINSTDPFWRKRAEEELKWIMERVPDITIEEDGAAKWTENGRYLSDDLCEKLMYGGVNVSIDATSQKRKIQTADVLKRYAEIQNSQAPSPEELYEMRAAFGENAVVTDVVTGQRIDLSDDSVIQSEEAEHDTPDI